MGYPPGSSAGPAQAWGTGICGGPADRGIGARDGPADGEPVYTIASQGVESRIADEMRPTML